MTTKEQVIELAKQAGIADGPKAMLMCTVFELERFATLVRNAALEDAKQAVAAIECPQDEDDFEAGILYGIDAIEKLKDNT